MTPAEIVAIARLLFLAAPEAKNIIDTIFRGEEPTPEQLAALDDARKSAKARLDASVAAASNN